MHCVTISEVGDGQWVIPLIVLSLFVVFVAAPIAWYEVTTRATKKKELEERRADELRRREAHKRGVEAKYKRLVRTAWHYRWMSRSLDIPCWHRDGYREQYKELRYQIRFSKADLVTVRRYG
jgi:hypothetical protein